MEVAGSVKQTTFLPIPVHFDVATQQNALVVHFLDHAVGQQDVARRLQRGGEDPFAAIAGEKAGEDIPDPFVFFVRGAQHRAFLKHQDEVVLVLDQLLQRGFSRTLVR